MKRIYNLLKLRKSRKLNVWNTVEFSINNQLFSKNLFNNLFNQFWNEISDNFTESNHMFILLKIKYHTNEFVTIGNLQRLNHNDKNWYINWIINNMVNKSEYYNETAIESIIFSYGFKDGLAQVKENFNVELKFHHYKDYKLPITMNPLEYGKLIKQLNNIFFVQINESKLAIITQFEGYNEVEILSGGDVIFKYKDEFVSEDKFVRSLDNKTSFFDDGKEVLYFKTLKTKFISNLAPSQTLNNNFITLDIETYVKDNILVPFIISIYDGNTEFSFSVWDYKNSEDMIISALESIMIRKYNGYNIYIHNMANFDIIFQNN